MRETTRQLKKFENTKDTCSCIIPEQLFLSGSQVSNNRLLLLQLGITHILNCAGNFCQNAFPELFTYKTYFIKDSKLENIECLFYECFDFIDSALQKRGKVLVHCAQGISRSVTIVIAFIIIKFKISYSLAYEQVRSKRDIASPNVGFIA